MVVAIPMGTTATAESAAELIAQVVPSVSTTAGGAAACPADRPSGFDAGLWRQQ